MSHPFKFFHFQHYPLPTHNYQHQGFQIQMNLFDNEILFANLLQETLPLLFEQLTLTPILFGCLTFSTKILPQIMGKL